MSLDYHEITEKCCRPSVNISDTGHMSTYEKLCYVLQKLEETIDYVNTEISNFQADIDAFKSQVETDISGKEDSVNITNNRKLSESGDFTGTIHGEDSLQLISEIDTNTDQIAYLLAQFSAGQTGFVIDGGFFTDSIIQENYNGGVW